MQESIMMTFGKAEFITLLKETLNEILIDVESVVSPVVKNEKNILTRKEASEMLAMSLPTLDRLTKEGKVKGFKLGRNIRYKREDVLSSLREMNFGFNRKK